MVALLVAQDFLAVFLSRFCFTFLGLRWETIDSEGIAREYTSSQPRMFP